MKIINTLTTDYIPPILVRVLKKMLRRKRPGWYFSGSFKSWEEAINVSSGYKSESILNKVLESTLKVKNGEYQCERDSVLFEVIEYSWPLLACLMWVGARNRGVLNVLDFGGALGSSYFQNRKFLKSIPNLSWIVVEQPHYVQAGLAHIQNDQLSFSNSMCESFYARPIGAVIFSAVLQHLDDPYSCLMDAILLNAPTIIVDRTIFLRDDLDLSEDEIVMQIVSSEIFKATLPCWLLSYKKMKDFFEASGYQIIEKFSSIGGNGENWHLQGFIADKLNGNFKNA